jgi:DNA gyrase inhibitor GyrI
MGTIREEIADENIRIVELDPMRVATVRVISENPENDAWEKLSAWANPLGLFADFGKHPVFGFNNPNPSPRQKEYGYEFWIRVDSQIESEGDIEVKEFQGGLFAMTSCKISEMGDVYRNLWKWVNSSESRYAWREDHELEKPRNPLATGNEMEFDIYMPVQVV